MTMPIIEGPHLLKPVSYDPARGKFILFEEIVSGEETIVPVDVLSAVDFKKLVIERQLAGPDFNVQSMSGSRLSRDDVVQAIQENEPFGTMTIEAEKSYLRDLLQQIQQELE